MDKRENIINIVKKFANLVREKINLPDNQFWLYGSFAKGNTRAGSDIDVALVVNNIDDKSYWNINKQMWQLTYDVDARIEPKIVLRNNDYSGFLDEIRATGIEIK
jgi:predicted nucleotidyltransferase